MLDIKITYMNIREYVFKTPLSRTEKRDSSESLF